jgi:hypothetical protein
MNQFGSETIKMSFNAVQQQQEISRILTAAVINESFRKQLLANPDKALAAGYRGEPFHLATEERSQLASIRASSLAEFAAQIPQMY